MCIHVQSITYMHPDKDVLFSNVSFTISKGQKVALIGNNGSGKSTLMRLITKELLPSEGQIICPDIPYSIPQHFGQFNHLTVAGALGIERKLYALHAILQGDASIEHFTALADDWKIEEKAVAALNEWGLVGVPLSYPMHLLSGGEKTKVFLAGITIYFQMCIRDRSYIEHTSSHYVEMNQNTVDLYLMKNGKPILADGSGYHGNKDMYAVFRDRDPRLYHTVIPPYKVKSGKGDYPTWSYTDNPADREYIDIMGANESCSNPGVGMKRLPGQNWSASLVPEIPRLGTGAFVTCRSGY